MCLRRRKDAVPQPPHFRHSEEYLRAFQPDLATEEERDAYSGGQYVKIRLPRVPARPRSYEGYKQEFIEAGFTIEHFQRSQAGYTCQIYVRTGGR